MLFQAGMDVVFLIYGASFLAMGLAVFIRYDNGSQLKLGPILWLLGTFGLVHGFREWMDLWRVVRGDDAVQQVARPVVLLASYVVLFEFGRRLTIAAVPAAGRWLPAWLSLPLLLGIAAGCLAAERPLVAMDIWSRYLLGFTGSALAGLGFHQYCRRHIRPVLTDVNADRVVKACTLAGISFGVYAVVGGLVTPAADWFPASVINQDQFLAALGVPVQLVRAASAVVMAVSVGLLLKVFHLENGQRLLDALNTTEQHLARLRLLTRQNELILNSTSEGVLGIDLDGRAVFVNTAAQRLLGFERDELIGELLHSLTHHTKAGGESYPVEECPVHRAMWLQMPERISEDVFWRKDGSSFAAEYEASPLIDETQVVGAVVVFQDITERRLSEEKIRNSEERFRTLVEGTTDWVWETDDQHRLVWFSDSFETIFGAPVDGMLGRRRWDLACENHAIDPSLWAGHMADLYARRPFRDFRYWIRLPDGSARWISIDGSPRFDGSGVFLGYRGSGSDMTAEAETDLRLKMLSTVVEQSPISVLITAPDNTIEYVNGDTVRLTGWSADELVGSSVWRFSASSTPVSVIAEMDLALAAGSSWSAEMESRRKTGETFWERITVSPIIDDAGHVIHHLWIREDVSFRKEATARIAEANRQLAEQADQLRRSNAELEQFAYVASHDLRQPLRMISSYLSLVERKLAGHNDGDLANYLNFARGGARRMERLILDLLEYSRIGRQDTALQPVPLTLAVEDAILNLEVAIHEAEAEVTVTPGLPVVMGNPGELTRLFQNLVGNAVKYRAPDRPPRVAVGWRDGGGEWLLSVADNGIGIAPDQRERAFAVFQRLVSNDRYEGTGIGLAVCKKIVENHGGRIWIEGEPGQGSIFMLALPKLGAGQ